MNKLLVFILLTILFSCSANNKYNDNLLKGYYSYLADVGIFTDCETNKKYPVAFEADNISLERAYLEVVENAGEKMIVTLSGHFERRAVTEGVGEKDFLIVDKFNKIWPNIDCVRNLGTANLKNTFWSLRELNRKPISKSKNKKDTYLIIKNDNSIKGFSGCNNYFGNSYSNNDSLKFSNLGSTLIACKNMDVERELFEVYNKTDRYKIYGEFLYLYSEGNLVAKLESVYFN